MVALILGAAGSLTFLAIIVVYGAFVLARRTNRIVSTTGDESSTGGIQALGHV